MRQISLMDSFKKKPKTADPPTDTKDQNRRQTSNPQIDIEQFREDVYINNPKNNFKDIISDEYVFGGVRDHNKRKKMEIENDEDIKLVTDLAQNQSESQEEQQQRSTQKRKKKVGRPQSAAKPKKVIFEDSDRPNRAEQAQTMKQQFTDVTPQWATAQGCRDNKGRRPSDPNYDPTTLFIPAEAYKGLTETMKQFWRIKSENFDKIILFKLGKFYEMFYEDAAIGNRYLDLKWMGSKMHVGFPEKCLDKYAYQFTKLGFKLTIVEQLETPDQMKERMAKEKAEGTKSEKTLQRGVTQVLTKGTIVSFMDENQYLPNYLIAVFKHGDLRGYSLLQIGTNLIMVGYCESLQQFKTMLFQTRPVQLLYDPDNLSFAMVEMMKQNWLQMVLTRLPNKENVWHFMNAKNQIENLVNKGVFKLPAVFESLRKVGGEPEQLIMSTLSGMFRYLKSCLKFDYIMSAVRFSFYEREGSAMCMVMDSQALQHLEVFETPIGEKDSLFSKLDRTSTKFGKRLFRRWLMQPLMDPVKINQRLDAVEDLEAVHTDRNRVAEVFSKLPDLQRIVNRLYHYSVKTIAEKAVYFQDVSSSRLREFRELIEHFNRSWNVLQLLRKSRTKFKSKRLISLLTLEKRQGEDKSEQESEQAGLLPLVREHLVQFDQYIKWEGDLPAPQKGLVDSYDMLQDELSELKAKMDRYLQSIRVSTGISAMRFVHTKQRYQIEIPEQLQKKRLADMIFTSKRSGFSRYVTEKSRKMVADIEFVQQQIKEQMGLFVGYFFEEFRKNQKVWEKFLAVLAEIDCLVSLSLFSYQSGGFRPQFVQKGFTIGQAKHPCLNAGDVIANDIDLNSKVMLLTGPNMGGKSTLLRTTCLMVIMAQMGCFVPAESYECEIIDRIFTRIGASDKLQEGKSTFFIQMEETKSVLVHGTGSSLAIIDELGRGTSTFDGMAIAYSVLLDIIQRVQCRCIFATHYHSLSQQFQGISAVRLMMMDYILAEEKIIFLYKLKEGRSEQSFGINVAQVVKIPKTVIERAKEKSLMMQKEISVKDKIKKLKEAISFARG